MQDPSAAFKNNPRTSLLIDLEHQAVGPMYGHVGEPGDGNEFAKRTRSSTCAFKGSCNWEMRRPSLSKVGVTRPQLSRDWQATPSYRWITGNFGDDLGMIVTTNGQGQGKGLFKKVMNKFVSRKLGWKRCTNRVPPSTDRSGRI